MKRAVLVRRDRNWPYARKYISKKNPIEATEDIREAFFFRSISAARHTKNALRLLRQYAAKPVPGWLVQ